VNYYLYFLTLGLASRSFGLKKVTEYLTIKKLTETVGGNITPRMVRHYHQLGLLPEALRSPSNYRLYTEKHVQHLRRIVALKQQGFQLEHIRKLLETEEPATDTLIAQLQQQYRSIIQQITRLRQTASALEGLLGRDRHCQKIQAEAIAQLKLLEVETKQVEYLQDEQIDSLWKALDAAAPTHPEEFQESLQQLLPDLSDRSEIEIDLLSKLVLACGDVSLVNFVKISPGAIAAARNSLQSGCQVVTDVRAIAAALDSPRLAHLGCQVNTLIDDPHITTAVEAEQEFWQHQSWQKRLEQLTPGCIIVVGYAPSVLISVCQGIEKELLKPFLIIGMPIGFSHAPAAKRLLMNSSVPFITTLSTIGGGLLAATALNALAQSLLEKPDCHCYLTQ
jgi:precorrin-8X/cobalt-precorrin-8 methylmutase